MIGFFPQIYPDELAYSWFARYYLKSGYSAYRDALKDLYNDYMIKPSIEFINPMTEDAIKVISSIISIEELVSDHTMLPYYTRFLSADKKRKAFANMVAEGTVDRKSAGIPIDRSNNQRVLRYCPICFKEDRERYGEAYWHRLHQIRELEICHIHFCKLFNSKICISARGTPRLYPLDAESICSDIDIERDSVKRNLTSYVCEVVSEPIDFNNNVLAEQFLDSKLDNTPYVSFRGQQRHMALLHKDYTDYYKESNIMSLWQMEKLFNGNRIRTFEVCQLALFLGIKPAELVKMQISGQKREVCFDNEIKKLRNLGYSYPDIAKKFNVPLDTVKNAVREKHCARTRKPHNYSVKPGPKRLNYDEIDEQLLSSVKKASKELYSGNGSRPQRVTVYRIERLLGLPCKRLQLLPRCLAEIKKYDETIEHYWAREVVWAVKKLKLDRLNVNYRHIRDLTNLNKENFEACLQDLKLLNEVVYEECKRYEIGKD